MKRCAKLLTIIILTTLTTNIFAADKIPSFSKQLKNKSIPLNIDIPTGIKTGIWPVTTGVPFPREALTDAKSVTVLENGKAIATQTVPLAFWNRQHMKGEDIRWLLVDFKVDASSVRDNTYALTWGKGTETEGLTYKQEDGKLTVNTGKAEFIINEKAPFAITSAKSAGRQLVKSDKPVTFDIIDHKGTTFTAAGDIKGVEIEDSGPNRLGIRSEGWYISKDGRKFCQHIIRIEFFADSSKLKILHTFIFTGTSDKNQIRDIAVNLPLSVESGAKAIFGTSADDISKHAEVKAPTKTTLNHAGPGLH
ncbi:MAG: exo-rhamnogalacturonan lyase family protein [Planctomycetota bacterium]|jgi:hypothetical protein